MERIRNYIIRRIRVLKLAEFYNKRKRLSLLAGIACIVISVSVLLVSGLTKDSPLPEAASLKLIVFPEKYSPAMSSTPGIRILAEYSGDAARVRYTTDSGVVFTWDNSSGKISKGEASIEVPYGSPAYWSPLVPGNQASTGGNAAVTVMVLDNKGIKIDEKQVIFILDGLMNYSIKPSPDVFIGEGSQKQPQSIKSLDEAVSQAVLAQGKGYGAGEFASEGHVILDTEEKDGKVKVYTISSFQYFGFQNGIFTSVSGSGAIPTVIVFYKNERGEYTLLEYKEPMDGAGNQQSTKDMFPQRLWDKVFSADKSFAELRRQQEEQASRYLESIGRKAKVSAAYVERKLANINVEASNALMRYGKYNLQNYPYWLGTAEQIEKGVRYVYEKSQGKTDDGFDLITFKKTKEDGTIVEEYQFKIVGSEPQLIKKIPDS